MTGLDRRKFIVGLGTSLAAIAARQTLRAAPTAEPPAAPPRGGTPPAHVLEIRGGRLRNPEETESDIRNVVRDLAYGAPAALLDRGLYPLDAVAEIFPGEPPVSILVDARNGGPLTSVLVSRLSEAIVEMGSPSESVRIVDETTEDLEAGGYAVTPTGSRSRATLPAPGYERIPAAERRTPDARISRLVAAHGTQIAVAARLSVSEKGMGPFVIDAALRAFDAATRRNVGRDPSYGAKLLSGPLLRDRVKLVIADLITIPLDAQNGKDGASGGAVWRAGEILIGDNLFAVERVGHRILANTRAARGTAELLPAHPVLAAAEKLGVAGAALDTIDWRKMGLV